MNILPDNQIQLIPAEDQSQTITFYLKDVIEIGYHDYYAGFSEAYTVDIKRHITSAQTYTQTIYITKNDYNQLSDLLPTKLIVLAAPTTNDHLETMNSLLKPKISMFPIT